MGWGTPLSHREMIEWLLSVDEEELARRQRDVHQGGQAEEGQREERAEAERKGSEERKGKGKGRGGSGGREADAEERHVRRQEKGWSK